MAWLLRDGDVLAAIDIARSRRERRRAVAGRPRRDAAVLLEPAGYGPVVAVRAPVDVAFCARTDDGGLVVQSIVSMGRWRMTFPRLGACRLEAGPGAFARWRLSEGDLLEVR